MPWYCSVCGYHPVIICFYYSEIETNEYIESIKKVLDSNDVNTSNLLSSGVNTEVYLEPFFFNQPLLKTKINLIKIDKMELFCNEMDNINENLIQNSLFISTRNFVSQISHNSFLKQYIIEYDCVQCKDPESFLITYLELNGIIVNHISTTKLDYSYNYNAFIDVNTISKLQIIDGTISLINTINISKRERCKNEFNKRLFNPENMENLMIWFNVISKLRSNPYIPKICELIKSFSDIRFIEQKRDDTTKNEDNSKFKREYPMSQSILSCDPETSILFDKTVSYYSKSIYSKKNLEEKSISSYRRIIKEVSNFKSNIGILYRLGKHVSTLNLDIDGILFNRFMNTLKIYDQSVSKEINQILNKIEDSRLEDTWGFMDKYAFVIKSNVDPYLDLCRRNYEEKMVECQSLLFDIMKDTDLKIYMTDTREICLARSTDDKTCDYMIRKHSKVEPKCKLFIMKESKTMILYSCVQLKAINRAIKETWDQIIEIEGRLCKSILIDLKKYSNVFFEFSQVISQMDLLVNCIIFSRDLSFKKPTISNTVSIHDTVDCVHRDFKKVSYVFEEDTVYVITGANMAGKSCYVKNFARIAILVRIGVFINCEYIKIPIYDEIYLIENVEDLNNLIKVLLDKNINIQYSYRTPKRLVIIDELHCNISTQYEVLKMLRKSKILTLFITHNTVLIKMLKENEFGIFTFEDYRLVEGINNNITAVNICSRFFPEIVEALNEKLKISY